MKNFFKLIDFKPSTSFRERSRSLSEAINKLDKFRTSLQIRKRPRTEGAGHERQIASGSGDRSTIAAAAAANSFLNEGENLIFRQNVTQVNGGAAANIDPPGGSYSTSFGD